MATDPKKSRDEVTDEDLEQVAGGAPGLSTTEDAEVPEEVHDVKQLKK